MLLLKSMGRLEAFWMAGVAIHKYTHSDTLKSTRDVLFGTTYMGAREPRGSFFLYKFRVTVDP